MPVKKRKNHFWCKRNISLLFPFYVLWISFWSIHKIHLNGRFICSLLNAGYVLKYSSLLFIESSSCANHFLLQCIHVCLLNTVLFWMNFDVYALQLNQSLFNFRRQHTSCQWYIRIMTPLQFTTKSSCSLFIKRQ